MFKRPHIEIGKNEYSTINTSIKNAVQNNYMMHFSKRFRWQIWHSVLHARIGMTCETRFHFFLVHLTRSHIRILIRISFWSEGNRVWVFKTHTPIWNDIAFCHDFWVFKLLCVRCEEIEGHVKISSREGRWHFLRNDKDLVETNKE